MNGKPSLADEVNAQEENPGKSLTESLLLSLEEQSQNMENQAEPLFLAEATLAQAPLTAIDALAPMNLMQQARPSAKNENQSALRSEGSHNTFVITQEREEKMKIKLDQEKSAAIFSKDHPISNYIVNMIPVDSSTPFFSVNPNVGFEHDAGGDNSFFEVEPAPAPKPHKPVDTKPVDTKPSKPAVETKPVADSKPAIDSEPVVDNNPAEVKPAVDVTPVEEPIVVEEPFTAEPAAELIVAVEPAAEPNQEPAANAENAGILNTVTSYFSLLNPVNLSSAMLSQANQAYHRLFDPKIVSLEEIQSLEQKIAADKSSVADLQAQIKALDLEASHSKAQLDSNVQQAVAAYKNLEAKSVGTHDLIEAHAPATAGEKIKEGFTASWAKVNPAEVSSYLLGLTPETSSQDINWIVDHIKAREKKLATASENADKKANALASQMSGETVDSTAKLQAVLEAQKNNIAELNAAKEAANLSFKINENLYKSQAFYDFSKNADYKSSKALFDEASTQYDSAVKAHNSLNLELASAQTLQQLWANASSANECCNSIQSHLDSWQAAQASLKQLTKQEKNLNYSLAKDESALASLQKAYELQNKAPEVSDDTSGYSLFDSSAWAAAKTVANSPNLMVEEVENSLQRAPSLLNYLKPVTVALPEEGAAIGAPDFTALEQQLAPESHPSFIERFTSYSSSFFSSSEEQKSHAFDADNLMAAQKAAPRIALEDVLTQPDFFTQKIAAPRHFESTQHINYYNTLNDVTQNAKQAYGLLQLRDAQLNHAKMNYDEATRILELSKEEAGNLDNPKASNEGKFGISFLGGETVSTTYSKATDWQNEAIENIDVAALNKNKSQEVFDQELGNINHKHALNLSPEGINFKSISTALENKLVSANVVDKAKLEESKVKVESMQNDIKTWDKVITDYKAQEKAYNHYVEAQKNYLEAKAGYDNNESILSRVQTENPVSSTEEYAHNHGLSLQEHSLEQLGAGQEATKHLLDGF